MGTGELGVSSECNTIQKNEVIDTDALPQPELFNTRLRGKAGSVSTSFNWLFNFALSYFVPPAFSNIQWKSYIIFGVFCVTMFIHVFFAFPETKGKSLEVSLSSRINGGNYTDHPCGCQEIDEIFQSNVPAWRSRKLTDTSRLDQLADAVGRGENIDKAESITKSGSHSPGEESETKYTIA
jgi:hypothetical protein